MTPIWLNIAPLGGAEGDAEAAADAKFLLDNTPIDAFAYSMALFPEGKPLADKATPFAADFVRRRAAVAKAAPGLRQGILFQATMGHGWTPNVPAEGQLVVRKDGSTVYKFCPLAQSFRDYMRDQARTLAATKPDFFMIDDDTRLNSWVDGCFCPGHLAEFSRRTGRTWTREALVAALDADRTLAAKWDKLLEDSIADFLQIVRDAFPPDVPGEFCLCEQDAHQALRMAKILAAPGQKPVIRVNNSSYLTADLRCAPARLALTAREIAAIGEGEALFLDEPDTCPQNRYSCSATFFTHHILTGLFEGCKGAKVWITRLANQHERQSGIAYRKAFARDARLMKAVAKLDLKRTGVCCPMPSAWPQGLQPGHPADWGSDELAFMGIPWRVGRVRDGDICALREQDVAYLADDDLARILRGGVLLDGAAAVSLAKRGFAKMIGVEAKPYAGKAISAEKFGDVVHWGGPKQPADLSMHGAAAKVESVFIHKRSSVDPNEETLTPGSLSFVNTCGGRVFIMAASVPPRPIWFDSFAYNTETRKREILRALAFVGGGPMPVYYDGDAEILLESAIDDAGRTVLMADNLNLDVLETLPLVFARNPMSIEALTDEGEWRLVEMSERGGVTEVAVRLETYRPVFLRLTQAGEQGDMI
ncbi:MAG: hypothetical protein ILM98_07735 [Kiritimatiellae bacterium]|nr:hypothetical protein [Kiritimatiellia bacterium]